MICITRHINSNLHDCPLKSIIYGTFCLAGTQERGTSLQQKKERKKLHEQKINILLMCDIFYYMQNKLSCEEYLHHLKKKLLCFRFSTKANIKKNHL